MPAGRVRLDFPRTTRFHGLAFDSPVAVVRADRVDEVMPALARVHALTGDGAWAAGFVSYDAAPAFDAALRTPGRDPRLPLLWFGIYDTAVDVPARKSAQTRPGLETTWRPDNTRADYDAAIAAIREAIERGDVYQVNHTFRLHAHLGNDPEALYDRLRAAQGDGWFAFVDIGAAAILSASPELFFHTRGGRIVARPMKGTAPRGRFVAEDDEAACALAASAKDRAENLMIVDLVRNDLGRICRPGTVRVPRLFDVERYPTVLQLTSTIEGDARADVTLPDIFTALFPCGSVTGAPKIAAAEAIARLESTPREVYCGAVGVVAPDGEAAFNVAIRTVWVERATRAATYGTGGGVTWDSAAAAEYAEALSKAALLWEERPVFDLLETMRLEAGVYQRLDAHLARCAASARYFGRLFEDERVRLALADHARAQGSEARRARLRVDEAGTPIVDSEPLDRYPDPRRIALARAPVNSADRFLFHKTTHRQGYDERRAARPDADDVVLVNEAGELTESTTGNLVIELGARRLTPRREAGLLAGIFRDELLRTGEIEEARLTPTELERARDVWLVNSLRGWVRVEMMP